MALLCATNVHRENGTRCEDLVDDLGHRHLFLRQSARVFALQETDNWKLSEMKVPGHVCYGWNDGKKAMLCPCQLCQIRRSWENRDRCTAVRELEVVKIVTEEGNKMGATDFLVGGDLNIELELEVGCGEELQVLDSHDWYALCGPECLGSGADVETYEKKGRWLQLLRDFNCVVTGTWESCDVEGNFTRDVVEGGGHHGLPRLEFQDTVPEQRQAESMGPLSSCGES